MSSTGSQSVSVNSPKPAQSTGLKSMTGYAQARAVENGWSLRVTIRAVNHRFLDLHLRIPEGFEPLEPRIRQILARTRSSRPSGCHFALRTGRSRGGRRESRRRRRVSESRQFVAQGIRHSDRAGPRLDLALARSDRRGQRHSLEGEIERLENVVMRCLNEALEKLDAHARRRSQPSSREKCPRACAHIAALTAKLETLAENARPAFARRLAARLQELLGEAQLDPARLAQEASIAAERSDVSEELARLRSHVQQFESLLAGAADVGKKLDFLLQEMQRESNTLLSKTPGNDGEGLEITRLGLEIKSEIEKLREQVQNIE